MIDALNDKTKDWTNTKSSITVNVRCFNCNRLLCTGCITEGSITIKCGKCGRFITIGAHGATPATRSTLRLIR
ncbi:MAG: Com family DNA-binding transcriptional regulator [Nitrospina sp.]|nr:Com family DNA-binding transcriptional regulator [Nitrospina sp.]